MFRMLLIIVLYLIFSPFLPDACPKAFYAISLLMKDILLWLLPITVSFFIASSVASFEKKAFLFLVTLFFFEALSNSASVWYAYSCSHLVHLPTQIAEPIDSAFAPLFRLPQLKPAWWSPDKGVFAGMLMGFIPQLRSLIVRGRKVAELILTRGFARLIPLFILGFVARMEQTHLLSQILSQYAEFCLVLLLILILYIAFLFILGSGFSWKAVKNLLPAAGVAFSSGCSLSTMPWTIEGTSKNLTYPDLAKAVIPATTNIQQVGDCILNAFLCSLIYAQAHGHLPPLAVWIPFSAVFVLARYATAAVLGGAIFVMIPIYESYLHFTPEMIALILAFNVLLDPLVTCTNVIGNGALCKIFERILSRLSVIAQAR